MVLTYRLKAHNAHVVVRLDALKSTQMTYFHSLTSKNSISQDKSRMLVVSRVVNGTILVVTINRAMVKNAVNGATAKQLHEVFLAFDADATLSVAVLTGFGTDFCAGADLGAMDNPLETYSDQENSEEKYSLGPMGCSRLILSKPVIAAVEGFAVAGGLELACWCDMRVASRSAVFGVFCRRWGVPLIDGGTLRLPLLIGSSRAMDMILTGRAVSAVEALEWGLANRLCNPGQALQSALDLAAVIAAHPQETMRADRQSVYLQQNIVERLKREFEGGMQVMSHARQGAEAFTNNKSQSKL